MRLLEARVNGKPRQVSTKFGEKAVMDVVTADGQEIAIWRPAGDIEVMGRANGERVSITIDSKGKASLVEHASTKPQEAQKQAQISSSVPPEQPPSRSAEIADYIERLGKLYAHCLDAAARMPKTVDLNAPQVKDVATTFFLQAVRHFDL
jgi:hypothetical protein